MKAMKSMLVGVIIVFVTTSISKAEPSAPINYLINPPASMLDLGVFRLNQDMENIYGDEIASIVSYDFGKNRIRINLRPRPIHTFENRGKAKLWIEATVNGVKGTLGIDEDTGKPYDEEFPAFCIYFSHEGYELRSAPKTLCRELLNITEIVTRVSYIQGTRRIYFIGSASLLGTDIFFSEKENKVPPKDLYKKRLSPQTK